MMLKNLRSIWMGLLAGHALLFYACSQSHSGRCSGEPVTAVYDFSLPSKAQPGSVHQHRAVKLKPGAVSHVLRLGTAATPGTFTITDTGIHARPLLQKRFEKGKDARLDITALKKGTYKMTFTAIAESCSFEFSIE